MMMMIKENTQIILKMNRILMINLQNIKLIKNKMNNFNKIKSLFRI